MTSDELRTLADNATPGPWVEREGAPHDVLTAWKETDPFNRGQLIICEHAGVDAPLIAALGPDAARLLADAMDSLRDLVDDEEQALVDVRTEEARTLLARFAALGAQEETQ